MTAVDPAAAGWTPRSLEGFIGLVGPLWTRQENDGWAYAIVAEARHANRAGIVHGGLLVTLIDHALSAIAWEAAARRPCVTVQLDARFLAPAHPGKLIEARGRVARLTTGLAFMEGGLTIEGERVLSASAVLRVLEQRQG
jgi:uncharacterized protein (TIGR00369 family)